MTHARKALGDRAEALVAAYLGSLGYQIVARNLRIGALELDIVARANELIVVVEVRTRSISSYTTGLSSIGIEKRKRVRMAGERLWQRRYKNDASVSRMRFDVAVVSFGVDPPALEHIQGAF